MAFKQVRGLGFIHCIELEWNLCRNVSLSGMVYTHQISENRMTGQADRNMAKFVEPCGDKWAQSIALVTTKPRTSGTLRLSGGLGRRNWVITGR